MKTTITRLFILLLVISSCSDDDPIKLYNLNTTISPSEGGTVSPSSGTFDSGETFTLTSTPSENYVLKNWSGDVSGTENTISVIMDSDKNITVNFEKRDTDGDGVTDDVDNCPDTPNGETVDENGCSSTQIDNCQTCSLTIGTQEVVSEYCDNGDGTVTITTEGVETTEDLEGATFDQFIAAFELLGAVCN